eukprot:GEMP01038103.1.p1 GENE.GEMP01038103.1~~GEMP01038103.1.p1  ORF type:complete len:288 (+),score=82.00 GEMP01038103.1:235-1098(+)
MRMAETMREPPQTRLIEDTFARLFIDVDFASRFDKKVLDKKDDHVTHVACRTKFIDECILDAVHGDAAIRQLVICGAGCDMRAFRLALPDDMVVIEIDLPEIQAYKKEVTKTISTDAHTTTTHYIAVDFNTQSVADVLGESPYFLQDTPTIWLLEGVTMYISKDASAQFFAAASHLSSPQSRLLFSYVNTAATHTEIYRDSKASVARQGEPFVSTFDADELQHFVAEHSAFTEQWTDMGPEKYNEKYLRAVGRAREGVNGNLGFEHCVCVVRNGRAFFPFKCGRACP